MTAGEALRKRDDGALARVSIGGDGDAVMVGVTMDVNGDCQRSWWRDRCVWAVPMLRPWARPSA